MHIAGTKVSRRRLWGQRIGPPTAWGREIIAAVDGFLAMGLAKARVRHMHPLPTPIQLGDEVDHGGRGGLCSR